MKLVSALVVGLLLLTNVCWASAAEVLQLHVSPDGSDSSAGDSDHPLKSPEKALGRLKSAGTIVLASGTYIIPKQLDLSVQGTTIRAAEGASVLIEHGPFAGPVFNVTAADVTLEGLTLEGNFVQKSRAVRGKRGSEKLILRNCEVRNFTDHAVDVDGNETLIENCKIHHILLWNAATGEREDAHGVVTMHSHALTIRNCNVHQVSGDCFQADRGSWQSITIEQCEFWDGPLESSMAGFRAGARAAENAVDTKLSSDRERGRLVVKRSRFHGFRSTFIQDGAAFNLKENVDAVLDGCEISDSVNGLRLRGKGTKGGIMWPAVVNCTIRDCDVAVRYEDSLQNFRFVHNTVADCRVLFRRAPKNSPWGQDWVIANNLFVGANRLPEETPAKTNQMLSGAIKSIDLRSLKPLRRERLLGQPVASAFPDWYAQTITTDLAGHPRSTDAPTLGAFEAANDEPAK